MSRVSPNIAKIPTGTDLQLASRLAAVPYGQIIGGAFTAATDAQFSSAMVCVDWIKSVGFTGGSGAPGDMGELVMVDFVYERPGSLMGLNKQKNVMSVPFLTMVPLPSLRIESMKIQFNVKLNHTASNTTQFSGTTTGIGSQQSEKRGSTNTSNVNTTSSTATTTGTTELGNRLCHERGVEDVHLHVWHGHRHRNDQAGVPNFPRILHEDFQGRFAGRDARGNTDDHRHPRLPH